MRLIEERQYAAVSGGGEYLPDNVVEEITVTWTRAWAIQGPSIGGWNSWLKFALDFSADLFREIAVNLSADALKDMLKDFAAEKPAEEKPDVPLTDSDITEVDTITVEGRDANSKFDGALVDFTFNSLDKDGEQIKTFRMLDGTMWVDLNNNNTPETHFVIRTDGDYYTDYNMDGEFEANVRPF